MLNPDGNNRINGFDPVNADPLPVIHHLPNQRNSNFTGRREILSALADTFFSERKSVPVQVIKGMGGIGKSQVALEFAYRYSSEYEVVWWLRADDELTLIDDFIGFAEAAGLPVQDAGNGKYTIGEVRRWMDQHRSWLFIFDGVEHPDDLSEYLPEEIYGHVLVTSRHQMWEKWYPSTGVLYFSRNDSVEFLLQATDRKDSSGAAHIAELLADFPQALALAAATLNETNIEFPDYSTLFQKRHQALWKGKKPPLTYPDTLGSVVRIACEKIEAHAPEAVLMVNLFSYFAEGEIPQSLILETKKYFTQQFSSLFLESEVFDKALHILIRYSFLVGSIENMSLQRLIQAALRDRLDTTEQKKWSGKAVSIVNGIFPAANYQDSTVRKQCADLLSNGRCVAGHALKNDVSLCTAADLSDSIGSYLHARASFSKAEAFFNQALRLFEEEVGSGHPHVGAVVHNLATLYQDNGRLEKAEELFRRSLDICKIALGANHLYVGAVSNNFAAFLNGKGKQKEAESLFRRSLHIFQTKLEADHPQVATSLNNLAVLLQDQGKYSEAQQLLETAQDIYEKRLDKDHPFVATVLNNLAQIYQDQGMVDDSESLLRRALSIRESTLPVGHPDISATVLDLAGVLRTKGKQDEAEALYRKILTVCENKQGDDRLQVASCVMNLAKLLQQQGSHGKAEALFRKGLQIRVTQLSESHPDVASGMMELAGTLHGQGKLTEAESFYRNALKIHELQSDRNQPERATCLNNLAVLLCDQGRSGEAESFFRRTLQIHDEVLGTEHPDTATCRSNLSTLLKELRKTKEAEELLLQIPDYFTKERL